MPFFMKNIVFSQSKSFCKFSEFAPLSKSQSVIWFVGKSGVKYGNFQNGFKSLETFQK